MHNVLNVVSLMANKRDKNMGAFAQMDFHLKSKNPMEFSLHVEKTVAVCVPEALRAVSQMTGPERKC